MGNCLRPCLGDDSSSDGGGHYSGYHEPQVGNYPSRPFTVNVVGFTAFGPDLLEFESTSKLPSALSEYVRVPKATKIYWYQNLLAAWKRANPPPATAQEVAALIIQTLQARHNSHATDENIKELLQFYRLPWAKIDVPQAPIRPPLVLHPAPIRPPRVLHPAPIRPPPVVPQVPARPLPVSSVSGGKWPKNVQYEIRTLPVEKNAVVDGDGFTAFVDVDKDTRETDNLPMEIKVAVKKRRKAQARHDYATAATLQNEIQQAEYKVFDGKNGGVQCLARKYKIRLKGVDAPEMGQPYGQEAKDTLKDLVEGHSLLIHVYGKDQYKRHLGDVYCNGIFIQEELLKKGSAWHFAQFDKRPAFKKWERDAKAAGRGLWALDNPETPWAYKKRQGPRRYASKGSRGRKRGA